MAVTLFETALHGTMGELRHLVEYGCQNFRERDPSGNTVLHYAVRSGDAEKVRYLADYLNMDPLEANLDGQTPLDLAVQKGQTEVVTCLENRAGVDHNRIFHNPVRRGFYPDPSWIRVGQDYYMVNSSFFYFPCLPISRSRDLVHWTTVGYAITNPQWARVFRSQAGRGYWAPDISFDPVSGRYFITATYRGNEGDAEPRCQMVTSAESPEGPYGEPAWIHEDGIDPSLFHDADGKHYMLFNRSVRMVELSPDCRTARGTPWLIWGGDWKIKTEGPQMCRHNGWYYLFAAEGGTGSGHRISVARARNIWGPYENCPYNPILRQDDPAGYLQNCGHGKLLQLADGRWYLCYLCLRKDRDNRAPMGRETAVTEVVWTPDGWPVAAHGRRPATVVTMPCRADSDDRAAAPAGLVPWKGQEWVTPRALEEGRLRMEGDALEIRGNGLDLWETRVQGILLVRQQERNFCAETWMDTQALRATSASGSAGMTCYYDEHSYLKFGVQTTETGLSVLLEEYAGQEVLSRRTFRPVHGGPAGLRVTAAKGKRSFSVCGPEGQWQTLAEIPEPAYLTSEGLSVGKRFTGAMVGLYVHGNFAVRFLDWTVHWRRPETCTGEE